VCRRHGWYLQVGAFAQTARFERLRERLRRAGHAACLAPQHPKHLDLLFVGPYRSAGAARAEQPRLRKLLSSNNYLRHIPAR
jgi:cell division septation protein DedD